MNRFFVKVMTSLSLALSFGLMSAAPAQATAVLGSLDDGTSHTTTVTGWWSLMVNTGDVVTVTARRLGETNLFAAAFDDFGKQVGVGDDELPRYSNLGDAGDPQFSFTALTAGKYTVGVFSSDNPYGEDLPSDYFVSAVKASGNNVPEPGTIALLGLGLIGIVASRKLKQA